MIQARIARCRRNSDRTRQVPNECRRRRASTRYIGRLHFRPDERMSFTIDFKILVATISDATAETSAEALFIGFLQTDASARGMPTSVHCSVQANRGEESCMCQAERSTTPSARLVPGQKRFAHGRACCTKGPNALKTIRSTSPVADEASFAPLRSTSSSGPAEILC